MDFNDDFEYKNSSNTPDEAKAAIANHNGASYTNNDSNQYRYEKMNHTEMKRSNNKGTVKTIITAVTAGVVGSAITLAALPYTNYFKDYANNGAATQPVSTTAPVVNTVSAQPTSASNNSIPNIVQNVSKAIVGIENYQQQQNNSSSIFGNFGSSGGSSDYGSSGGYGSSEGFGGFGNNSNGSSGSSSSEVDTGSGSGVIFQKVGNYAYIVTNNHVVEGASKLVVSLYGGQQATAQVVGTDALTDLAVLKIPVKYVTNTAVFGDSSTLRPGDTVLAIGNPLGQDLSRTVTEGIVSATNRSIDYSTSAGDWQTTVIQTDAAINPGNSGGALINTAGQVVGINSLKISEAGVEGLGFAIPSNDVLPIVNQLINNGKVERPYLGIGLSDLSEVPQTYWNNLPSNVTSGVMVTNVDPNSAAAKGGFKQQDVIVSMDGTSITSSADLRTYLYTKVKIGDTVKFGVYRNGKLINITVKITSQTAN